MKIHSFIHEPSEGLGAIGDWIREQGHALTETHLHAGDGMPEVEEVDWLIVMGGPMNIYKYRAHPWLKTERRFIEKAIENGKPVLGICLGAQFIADLLGARVYQNPEIEIGWFPVRFSRTAKLIEPFKKFPSVLTPLHWHGDTFDLPPGAVSLAESDGCQNQAFALGDKIVGLQFHLEVRTQDVESFLTDYPKRTGPFIQTREEILAGCTHTRETIVALRHLLEAFTVPAFHTGELLDGGDLPAKNTESEK